MVVGREPPPGRFRLVDGERAVLTAQLEKRTASMLVSRGSFDEEIYRVQ